MDTEWTSVDSIESEEYDEAIFPTPPPERNGGLSYAELMAVVANFIKSKRCARDKENIELFLKPGPKSNCARVDAVYRKSGVKSHIKVQDRDQYWTDLEKRFPHLKELNDGS